MLDRLVQALVGEQLEGLVADLREAHVATRRTRLPSIVGITFWKSFTYGTSGFDHDHELRARLHGDVDVGGGAHAAVDRGGGP